MATSTTLIVAGIVRRGENLLLVEQQGPDDAEPSWMLPGGRVEPGETLLEGLARELKEETGLRLTGAPRIAFAVDIDRGDGVYAAITFECEADGNLAPSDPDGLVRNAAWVAGEAAFERLACVAWYDCVPLERFLSGEAAAGTVYAAVKP